MTTSCSVAAGQPIAGARLHDDRIIKVLDLGRESPLPLFGQGYRYGIFEEKPDGSLIHVEGGIMSNSRRNIKADFEIFWKEQSGHRML